MAKIRWTVKLLAGWALLGAAAAFAQSTYTASDLLKYAPSQPGIDCTTPSAAEVAACEVKQLGTGTNTGSLLLDAAKKPLRRIFTYTAGSQRITVRSFYKDGMEIYREIDTNSNGKADEYRWFNSGGMKWGVDADEDGKIDSWKMISEEEVAQEAFQAVVTNDFNRLKALFVSAAELKALELPAAYVEKIRTKLQQANTKFQDTVKKVDANTPATGRVEMVPPQCVPGESIGTSHDLFRYPSLAILYETKGKKHEWLQTGEMVKVGMAWRLIDVPFVGSGPIEIDRPGGDNTELTKVLGEIAALDTKINAIPVIGSGNPALAGLYLERVGLVDKALPLVKAEDRESWYKQKADNLQSASMNSKADDTRAMTMLRQLRDQIVAQNAKSSLAAYVSYRAMWSEYGAPLNNPKVDLPKAQAVWMEKLADFAKSYPMAEDTPNVLIDLATGSEFAGKDDAAKGYYEQLVKSFPQHAMTAKAEGAIRRLNLVGNRMTLAANTLSGQAFDIASLSKKVVVVYYWASYCSNCPADFAKLKDLRDKYGAKGFEVVTVNLDPDAKTALGFLQSHPAPGYAIFTPTPENATESPLAVQYGIMGLPSLFLVGKDGNVISRTIQINDLGDAIQKAQQ